MFSYGFDEIIFIFLFKLWKTLTSCVNILPVNMLDVIPGPGITETIC